jgi:hypothetical protein
MSSGAGNELDDGGAGAVTSFNAYDIKQMVNHVEFHHIISEKAALFNEL